MDKSDETTDAAEFETAFSAYHQRKYGYVLHPSDSVGKDRREMFQAGAEWESARHPSAAGLAAELVKLVDEMRTSGMYAYNFVHKLESLLSAPAPVGEQSNLVESHLIKPTPEMSIERAVEVLNERKYLHDGRPDLTWKVHPAGWVYDWANGTWIDYFGAIAIAEKYTRKEGTDAK